MGRFGVVDQPLPKRGDRLTRMIPPAGAGSDFDFVVGTAVLPVASSPLPLGVGILQAFFKFGEALVFLARPIEDSGRARHRLCSPRNAARPVSAPARVRLQTARRPSPSPPRKECVPGSLAKGAHNENRGCRFDLSMTTLTPPVILLPGGNVARTTDVAFLTRTDYSSTFDSNNKHF